MSTTNHYHNLAFQRRISISTNDHLPMKHCSGQTYNEELFYDGETFLALFLPHYIATNQHGRRNVIHNSMEVEAVSRHERETGTTSHYDD